jgi:hypothetical protein
MLTDSYEEKIILNDFAKKKNKEELEAVEQMKKNPLSYEDCIKQRDRNKEIQSKIGYF